MDTVFHDSLERLFGDVATPAVVRDIESGTSHETLWRQLIESGFADAMVAEDRGGAGLGLDGAFSLWFLCGRYALPVPLAQTMLARAACAQCGIDIPDGPIAISPLPLNHSEHALECRNVPFGKLAQWLVVAHAGAEEDQKTLLLPAATAQCEQSGVPGSLQASFAWNDPLGSGIVLEAALPWPEVAALMTAAQMAGAIDRVLDITVSYAGERQQFGRPIGKFQAVQQQLSVLAELASASRMAAEIGCREESPLTPRLLAAAVAKARASEAAETVVKIAHGVHAAMGITAEYDLQLYTRRLIEWRTDYGSAGYWNRRIGDAVLASEAASTLEFMLAAFFPESAHDQQH